MQNGATRKGTDFFTVKDSKLVELDPLEPGERHFATALRSRQHIWPVLQGILERLKQDFTDFPEVHILEIGAGTGAHAEFFPAQDSSLVWQPTDYEFQAQYNPDLSSLEGGQNGRVLPIYRPFDASDAAIWDEFASQTRFDDGKEPSLGSSAPIVDGKKQDLPQTKQYQVIYGASLVHMCPWPCTQELFIGASKLLKPGGALVLYGPFRDTRAGSPTEGKLQTTVKEVIVTGFRGPGDANFHKLIREERDSSWGLRDVAQLQQLAGLLGLELVDSHDVGPNNFLLHFKRVCKEVRAEDVATIRAAQPA